LSPAALKRLQRDAERYRFLRDRDPVAEGLGVPAGVFIGKVPDNIILTGVDADLALDREMRKK